MANEFRAKNGLITQGNIEVEGSGSFSAMTSSNIYTPGTMASNKITVSDDTVVTNLNAQRLDGKILEAFAYSGASWQVIAGDWAQVDLDYDPLEIYILVATPKDEILGRVDLQTFAFKIGEILGIV